MASINKLLNSDETPIHIDYINVNLSEHNNTLNIHTNIRSINKHLNELEHFYMLLKEKYHIRITSEEWIGNDFNSEYIPFGILHRL